MMDYWAENQGHSPLYAKFGTVPGRNCTHVYHDKHQATHYPLYLCEQQDQGRESSCWTVPGSRTGGALQDYTNWTDPELTAPSSHFPFILDTQSRQPLDLSEYPPPENREREWIAGGAHRAMRESERGYLREGWQRQWEPCSPVRYRGDAPKRSLSDSSYRELEAWAARYSHSLPRRKRMGVELRGASQGLPEGNRTLERDHRSVTDPRVAALHQTRLPANIRELGQWDRGGRQQPMTHYPSQPHVPHMSYMPDIKEKTVSQRRMFSQPPGYIAPPPYNRPHKSSPVMHHYDRYTTSWEQEGKRQTYCSQPTPRKLDFSEDLQAQRVGEKENFTKEEWRPKMATEFEGHRHQRQATDALWTSSPIHTQSMQMQPDRISPPQQPMLHEVQNTKIKEEPSPTVIEGRKFKFNKKTGGTTIFCLVSRISGTTGLSSPSKEAETPPLPLYTSQTNIQNKEKGEVSSNLRACSDIHQTHKLADEVDFSVQTVTEKLRAAAQPSSPRNLKVKPNRTPTLEEREDATACTKEMLGGYDKNHKTETDVSFPEMTKINDTNPAFESQVAPPLPPVSAKYPLWKEPSYTDRVETERSSPSCLKANSEGGESVDLPNRADSPKVGGHPIDIEVRRLEIKEDTESEDSSGLLVIDTTCVVVRMELIPSPKKEHVHYLSSPYTEPSPLGDQSPTLSESIQSDKQVNQDVTTDQTTETSTQINSSPMDEKPDTEHDIVEEKAPVQTEEESEISVPCLPPHSVSEKETLEERAERILGIPLLDSVIEQEAEDAMPSTQCVTDQEEEGETSQLTESEISDTVEQLSKDMTDESEPQEQVELGQAEDAACVKESNDTEDQSTGEGQDEQASNISEESVTDCQTDARSLQETEVTLFESSDEEVISEKKQEENNLPDDKDEYPQYPPQCLSSSSDLSRLSLHSPSDLLDYKEPTSALNVKLPSLSYVSESNTDENLHPELDSLSSSANLISHHEAIVSETCPIPQLESHTPFLHLPPPPPSESDVFSAPSPTPHQDYSSSPQSLDLLDQIEDAVSIADSCVKDQTEEGETAQLNNSEISDSPQCFSKDMTEEPESQQQVEPGQAMDAVCIKEGTDTQEQLLKDADEDLTGLQTSTIPKENTTDSQAQTEVTFLQDIEPSSDTSNFSPHPPSDSKDCEMFPFPLDVKFSPSQIPLPSHVSESNTDENPHPEMDSLPSSTNLDPHLEAPPSGISENCPVPQLESHTPSLHLPPRPPPESAALLPPGCPPYEDHSPSPQCLDLVSKSEDAMSTADACVEYQSEECEALQFTTNETSDALENLSKDMMEQPDSQQQADLGQADDDDDAHLKESYDAVEQLAKQHDDSDPMGLQKIPNKCNEGSVPEMDSLPSSAILPPHHESPLSGISETCPIPQLESHTPSLHLPPPPPSESAAPSVPNSTPCQDHAPSPQSLNLQSQTEDAMSTVDSCIVDQNEDGEPAQLMTNEISNVLELLSEDMTNDPELQQQVQLAQHRDAACVKEQNDSQEQLPKEADDDDDLAGLREQTSNISKENASDCQTEVNILQDTETFTDVTEFCPQPPSDSADCEMSPCALDVGLSPSHLTSQTHFSEKTNTEPVTHVETPSFCPSADIAPHPEADLSGISETSTADLDSNKPSLHFPSVPPSESTSFSPPSSTPPQEGSRSVSSDFCPLPKLTEEAQYPKSLWDAVNRIRKHTAPDSENEEEEASELWDPESVGEDLVSLDLVVVLKSEDIVSQCSEGLQEETVSSPSDSRKNPVFDKPGQPEFPKENSVEDTETGQKQQDKCPRGSFLEDSQSCGSTNGHSSGDTVTGAAEGGFEEKMSDAVTGSKKENEKESKTDCEGEPHVAQEERQTGKVKENNVVEEKGEDERQKESS